MVYDLSWVWPLFAVVALVALVGGTASLAVIGQSLTRHHRLRVSRHQSIPTYYRRLVAAH